MSAVVEHRFASRDSTSLRSSPLAVWLYYYFTPYVWGRLHRSVILVFTVHVLFAPVRFLRAYVGLGLGPWVGLAFTCFMLPQFSSLASWLRLFALGPRAVERPAPSCEYRETPSPQHLYPYPGRIAVSVDRMLYALLVTSLGNRTHVRVNRLKFDMLMLEYM